MDLEDLVKDRRTIQIFKREDVPWEDVRRALELSLWSLNHRWTFPWEFFVLGPEARARIAELGARLKCEKKPGSSFEVQKKAMDAVLGNPAYVMALGLKRASSPHVEQEDFATMACTVQLASLLLWQKGIGSKWSTSGFTNHEETYRILGCSPEEVRLAGFFFIGHAAQVPPARERPSLDTRLHWIS